MGNKPNRNKGKPRSKPQKKWEHGDVKINPHVAQAIKNNQEQTIDVPNDARLTLSCVECFKERGRPKLSRLILIGRPDELTVLMNLHKAIEHPQSMVEVQI